MRSSRLIKSNIIRIVVLDKLGLFPGMNPCLVASYTKHHMTTQREVSGYAHCDYMREAGSAYILIRLQEAGNVDLHRPLRNRRMYVCTYIYMAFARKMKTFHPPVRPTRKAVMSPKASIAWLGDSTTCFFPEVWCCICESPQYH